MTSPLVHLVACFLVGALFIHRGSRTLDAQRRHARWLKFGVFFTITFTLILFGELVDAGARFPLRLALWAIIIGGTVDVLRLVRTHRLPPTVIGPATLVLSGTALAVALMGESISGHDFVYLFGTIALFDGFSQACGQMLGRRRLAAATSPGKTVEGALGGTLFALIPLALYGPPMRLGLSGGVAVSVIICASALLGDLGASWLKRRAKVKDFSQWLPGHGGVLDRFDSLFGAAAAWTLLPGNGLV